MRLLTRISPLLLAVAMSTAAAPAFAQSDADRATARDLAIEGQAALDRKDFKTAEDRFKRADQLYKAPTLALGLARAYAGNNKFVAAQETYNRILRDGAPAGSPAAFQKAVDDAKAEVGPISARIGFVVINVTGADSPKVTLDDQPFSTAALGVKRAADPGNHVVRATAEGYKPAEARVTVAEAGTATASLTLEKDPNAVAAPPPVPGPSTGPTPAGGTPGPGTTVSTDGSSTPKMLGIVLLGIGGVGLITGGVTGVLAMGKHSSLEKDCPDGKCTSDHKTDVDTYHTLGLISTIGFVVGGVAAAGGAVLLLTAPKPEQRVGYIRPYVGFGTAGAVGRF